MNIIFCCLVVITDESIVTRHEKFSTVIDIKYIYRYCMKHLLY